nr:hypothetical protein [Bacilli bacterium]
TVDSYLEKSGDTDFKRDIFLRQYDYMLQTMLLAVALADGKASAEEIEAIRLIAKNGSIINFLNQGLPLDAEPWEWKNFTEQSPYIVAQYQLDLEKKLEDIIDNFNELLVITAINIEQPHKFLNTLGEITRKIEQGVITVDGILSPEEDAVIEKKIKEVYKASLNRVIEKFNNN